MNALEDVLGNLDIMTVNIMGCLDIEYMHTLPR